MHGSSEWTHGFDRGTIVGEIYPAGDESESIEKAIFGYKEDIEVRTLFK